MKTNVCAVLRTLCALVILQLIFCSNVLFAQAYSPLEVGIQGAALTLRDPVESTVEQGGYGTRISYNSSSLFAWEAESDFFPVPSELDTQRGGRAFALLAGPKATWRWHRIGLFVKAQPGIMNFSNIVRDKTVLCNGMPCIYEFPGGHVTHFALELGGGVEINASRRMFFRIDVGELLLRYGDRSYHNTGDPGNLVLANGMIARSLLVTAGVSYRLGHLAEHSVSLETTRTWEIGGQFGLLSLGSAKVIDDLRNPAFGDIPAFLADYRGIGGRLSYNFNRWLAVDAALTYYYTAPHVGDAQRGGKILEGVFGPKAGVRTRRYGVFAKARPGFLSYSAVHDDLFPPFPTQRLTHFALEVGGVLEYYPSRRTILRFDLGHLLAFYGPQTFQAPPGPPYYGNFRDYAFRDNGIQLMTGFGWRF